VKRSDRLALIALGLLVAAGLIWLMH